ncbi:aspartate--tRNA ligase [Haliangium ochraceum]|uniref:Aspartate--tRNA(Asp/Asn) ligase n=1 Tax=Haliangium ochraceum (strain DSM 14365 / JCM 11303 / SMP-2) TaxID=502025 RepID=D0LSI9_HALO1|nr:aspartyl-tRNA synthetase [Haliangium ochraceum DSM 14365]
MSDFLSQNQKTHGCGALRADDNGKTVVLTGWVDVRRDHGGCVFADLRDRTGLTQIVFDPTVDAEAHKLAGDLRTEYCIGVVGEVRSRGDNVNPRMPTGAIEVACKQIEIFSRAATPPFPIEDDLDTNEALRLSYRYLDLRRPVLQRNLQMRAQAVHSMRTYLAANGFSDIETPFLVKYTPGGARNFVVPSRLQAGSFYALAESPQIYKQLLMVAGFERYYQVVRCFRDEDLRLDRQPEFTQIDIELSFIDEKGLQTIIEGMIAKLWQDVLGVELQTPFLRMSWDEAMRKYGVDKPDLRLDLELCEITEACASSGFQVFENVIAKGGIVKCLRVPEGDRLSRTQLDGLTGFAKPYGVKGIAYVRVKDGGAWQGAPGKAFSDEARLAVNAAAGASDGDVLLFCADKPRVANTCMGAVRLHIGDKLGMIREGEWRFMWLTDPPLFEQPEDGGALVSSHHPFTSPRPEDEEHLESAPERVLARAYDLVLNGVEVGGGSIRIHRSDLQARIFKALGISDEEAQEKFGFLLEAFKYGPPPHGGIALGLDRLSMLLTGAESLRDVLAFPKTQKGSDLMSDAPTPVGSAHLDELYIQLKPELADKLAAERAAAAAGDDGAGDDTES